MSRPSKRNALDAAMLAGIEGFFSDPPEGTRAIIIYGEGKHFSAGVDLAALGEIHGYEDSIRFSRAFHRAFDRIENSEIPVIAVMQGAVIGGGLELAAAARIPRLIGATRMTDMMLTGRTYTAEEGMPLVFSQ